MKTDKTKIPVDSEIFIKCTKCNMYILTSMDRHLNNKDLCPCNSKTNRTIGLVLFNDKTKSYTIIDGFKFKTRLEGSNVILDIINGKLILNVNDKKLKLKKDTHRINLFYHMEQT